MTGINFVVKDSNKTIVCNAHVDNVDMYKYRDFNHLDEVILKTTFFNEKLKTRILDCINSTEEYNLEFSFSDTIVSFPNCYLIKCTDKKSTFWKQGCSLFPECFDYVYQNDCVLNFNGKVYKKETALSAVS